MKTLNLLLVLILVAGISTYGNTVLSIKGTVKNDKIPLKDVKIEVIKNGTEKELITTEKDGKIVADLDKNSKYKLVVSKEGFYTQYINIETRIDGPVDTKWKYRFVINLIPEIKSVSGDIFNEKLWIIKYNSESNMFENYCSDELKKKYRKFIKEYEDNKAIAYQEVVDEADKAFINKDYNIASELYTRAIVLNIYSDYPDMQLAMLKRESRKAN